MRLSTHSAIGSAAMICVSWVSAVHGQWSDLAAKAPASSNALVLMDVEKVLASPIAQREGWKGRFDKAFAAGLINTPPSTKRLLLAAALDYETWQPVSELALLDLSRDVSLVSIARQTKGSPDTVADFSALVLPRDAYIVELGKRRLAAMVPANRQAVVRWLRESGNRSQPALSPYLTAAVQAAAKIDIVQALDMTDALPPDVIRAKLNLSSVVGKATPKVDVGRLTSLLASLKGVLFEVAFTSEPHARFVVDFDRDATSLSAIGKPLLLEVLNESGARIADFDDWTPKVEANRFSLTGKLSPEGLRKVFSLIDAPIAALVSPGDEEDSDAGKNNQTAYASHAYFKSVTSIIDDLRKESKDSVTLGQNAAWIDRWARKIERLPMLNVDKDMLDYGGYVAASLRASSDAIKGIGINTGARTAQIYGGRYGSYGGYADYRTAQAQGIAISAEERAKGATSALGMFRQIEGATTAIRRTMTDRYKIEF
ncbi:MAG TPA: hypothetical protein VGG30_04730 [Pirellulales bacterium]|jgi:hypothetical protein